jgi:biopolymer transport protein ExbD
MSLNVSGVATNVRSEINITPLVDVVLVLLIIFMIVTPLVQTGYAVQIPAVVRTPVVPSEPIVLFLDGQGRTFINRQEVPRSQFKARLGEILAGRPTEGVFVSADGELPYDKVADFMDLCRNSGARQLGIVFHQAE